MIKKNRVKSLRFANFLRIKADQFFTIAIQQKTEQRTISISNSKESLVRSGQLMRLPIVQYQVLTQQSASKAFWPHVLSTSMRDKGYPHKNYSSLKVESSHRDNFDVKNLQPPLGAIPESNRLRKIIEHGCISNMRLHLQLLIIFLSEIVREENHIAL